MRRRWRRWQTCAGAASAADCGRLPVGGGAAGDHAGMGAAFVAMPGHKSLYGPQGTGLLLCREGGEPLPGGHRQPLTPAGDARLSAGPVGGGDPQRPRRGGAAGGAPVSPAAGDCRHPAAGDRLGGPAGPGAGPAPGVQVYAAWEKGCQTGVLSFRVAHRDPGGWPTPSASGAWRCGRGFTAPRWPMPPAAQRPQAPCASAFLPSTPAERWNVSSNTWQGWDRTNQSAPGFQGAFLSRRVKFPGPRGCKQGKNQV